MKIKNKGISDKEDIRMKDSNGKLNCRLDTDTIRISELNNSNKRFAWSMNKKRKIVNFERILDNNSPE